MTYTYNNVYIKDKYTIGGMYEKDGPIGKYFDKTYKDDLYINQNSWEKAEIHLLKEAVEKLIKNQKLKNSDIDLIISGDLSNQLATSNYAIRDTNIPFLGVYNACSTIAEAIIIGSSFIESKKIENCIVATASHNMVAEKQFRNPTEYGTPKHKTATFTATGAVSVLLSKNKTNLKVGSVTIGKICDLGINDVNHMGAAMAPAAAETIYEHLTSLGRDSTYYDLIVTGDLGIYGKNILLEYLKTKYNLDISNNYDDCGTMLYDLDNQPVLAGGSGPVCSALVSFGYLLKLMNDKKMKRILIVPTGALFSPTLLFQKETIPSIAHAISVEVV